MLASTARMSSLLDRWELPRGMLLRAPRPLPVTRSRVTATCLAAITGLITGTTVSRKCEHKRGVLFSGVSIVQFSLVRSAQSIHGKSCLAVSSPAIYLSSVKILA